MPKPPIPHYLVTDLASHTTYIVEPRSRRRNARLDVSAMPATGRELDQRVPWREVPLYIRRSAKEALHEEQNPMTNRPS